MGYAHGRRLTDEKLFEIASLYKTRYEFQKGDSSAYSCAWEKGKVFLDKVCSHMITVRFSTPQLILKAIFENILEEKCNYNDRKTIYPYELDLYFESFNLAIEYNGKAWHKSPEAKKRDITKRNLCSQKNISLLVFEEDGRNYEADIKRDTLIKLEEIKKLTNKNILRETIELFDCSNIYYEILESQNIDSIKQKINSCKNVGDFQRKYQAEYKRIRRAKQDFLLDPIRVCGPFNLRPKSRET